MKVLQMTERVETGKMQVGNDWPGVFIRGDEALAYAGMIHRLGAAAEKLLPVLSDDEMRSLASLMTLAEVLESCRVG